MNYGSWNGPEAVMVTVLPSEELVFMTCQGEASDVPPAFLNFSFATISSNGAKQVANITGLPDSPVTDIVFKDVRASNYEQGIQCQRLSHSCRGVKTVPSTAFQCHHMSTLPRYTCKRNPVVEHECQGQSVLDPGIREEVRSRGASLTAGNGL